ncbi:MAG: hypothetical protein U5J99_03060 [Parvularculaceae bacterium]|nr:hypothetical protein [Parvularculaceae bacterium]
MRVLLATLALIVCAACARPAGAPPAETGADDSSETAADASFQDGGAGQPKTIEDLRAASLAALDQEACKAKGGEVRQEGMLGAWRCTLPYADAGKVCRDKTDCEGKCLLPPQSEAAPGEAASGVCQANDSPFGCYAEIEDGKLGAALCVD